MLFIHSLFFLHLLGRKLCCFIKIVAFFIDIRHEDRENPIGANDGYEVGSMERKKVIMLLHGPGVTFMTFSQCCCMATPIYAFML